MISFNSLPYLFQERFVETVKIEILCKFLQSSSSTLKLCKKRKIVQNLEYAPSTTVPKKTEAVMKIYNVEDLQKFKTLEITDELNVSLFDPDNADNSKKPYQFEDFKMIPRTYKRLNFTNVILENISDITNLISPNLVEFTFLPRNLSLKFSPTWEKELNDLFAALDKVEDVRFMIGFNRDETPEEFKKIDGIIQKWRSQRKNKSPQSYWHIALRHGLHATLGKIYRKVSNKDLQMRNCNRCYNYNFEHERYQFEYFVHRVFLEKDS